MSTEPPILRGTDVLPPLLTPDELRQRANRTSTSGAKANGKTGGTKHRDRFQVLNAFVDFALPCLTRAEALTWLVLFRDVRDGVARTSVTDIARRIGASRRAVLTAIQTLRRRNMLTEVYRGGLNRGASSYRLHPLPKEGATLVKRTSPALVK